MRQVLDLENLIYSFPRLWTEKQIEYCEQEIRK